MKKSELFAKGFDNNFKSGTKSISDPKELDLFRELHKSIIGLRNYCNNKFEIEEYHGSQHQVSFNAINSIHIFETPNRRCELSDLMVIVYSLKLKLARLTFLQAKYERKVFSDCPCCYPWKADLVQWDLLYSRPLISGRGVFSPPKDLLQSALLPSVGSFGFFFRNFHGEFEVFYSSAHCLHPLSLNKKKCDLILKGPCCYHFPYIKNLKTASGAFLKECQVACGNFLFAKNLYDMHIGTPVASSIKETQSTRTWLGKVLRAKIRKDQRDGNPSELSQELLNLIGEEREGDETSSFGAKSLIIIKSDISDIDFMNIAPETR